MMLLRSFVGNFCKVLRSAGDVIGLAGPQKAHLSNHGGRPACVCSLPCSRHLPTSFPSVFAALFSGGWLAGWAI